MTPEIQVGQKVWKEGRPHKTQPYWFASYGTITDLMYFGWCDEEEEIDTVQVLFDDDTVEEVHASELVIWHDPSQCWQIYKD